MVKIECTPIEMIDRGNKMEIEETLPDRLRKIKGSLLDVLTLGDAANVIENMIPSLDLLQSRLEDGCKIKKQDGVWYLFEQNGEGVCSGETIREMLINLIFVDC